jgi:outer membrane receptor protein involved in Fe transport
MRTASSIAIMMYALASANAAFAQAAQPTSVQTAGASTDQTVEHSANPATSVETGEIVVTGTRVVRDGYKAPTPVSVIGAQEIAAKAPNNLADYVNTLPSVSASTSPRANVASIGGGFFGINALNLRGLGANRTLILLDGQRVAASNLTGLVDINTIPQSLVKRIDVVTGGASASWGSDAVAGVVNFVLDKDFTGIKGTVQGGVTTYGDDRNYNISLTAGAKFADGRGHILLNGELAHNDGITGLGKRTWFNHSAIFNNPAYTTTNGQPRFLNAANVGIATATPGGLITSGPLKGTYFGPGGVPAQFNYGSIVGGNQMIGGDYLYSDLGSEQDLDPKIGRQSIFGRVSYDFSDHFEVYAQGSYNRATTYQNPLSEFFFGSFVIKPDNAFIPASIAPSVTSSFNLGSLMQDLGGAITTARRSSYVGRIGAKGDFNALGSHWTWDVSGQRTINHIYTDFRQTITANLNNAIDAVRNANGVIVCRSTLTNPNNGCVPYSLFGTGVNSDAARNYVLGTAWGRTRLTQDVFSGTLRGEPFSTWAGPISIATGIEHRREATSGSSDPISLTRGYWTGGFLPTFGSYTVTEGFFETVVPLAKDLPFAHSLDLNGAVRATNYSTSGYVTTWKAGLTYSPIEDITFRFTRSRDIRAPNLQELFVAGQAGFGTVNDPFNGNAPVTTQQITKGNINLKPEVANSLTLGAVVQPKFLPGFAASVDFYNIDIKNAITTPSGAQVLNQCFTTNSLCSQITRDGNKVITLITVYPVNVAKQTSRGLDFEASYRHELAGGMLTLRGLATRFLKNYNNDGINPPTDTVGTNGANTSVRNSLPKWKYSATIAYDRDPVSLSLTGRGFSAGVYNTSYIECTTNCPVQTQAEALAHPTINNNRLPGAIYFDTNVTFKLRKGIETFLAIDNIADKDPAQAAFGPGIAAAPVSVNALLYDVLGRTFRFGVRFKM